MPTKFVTNTAHKMGTSVEHAEKVWHDAKQAVKKGKRRGSWYWGKVINTFKRMMGVTEQTTFAEFAEVLTEEDHEEVDSLYPSMTRAAAALEGWPSKLAVGQGYYLDAARPLHSESHLIMKYRLRRLMDDTHYGSAMAIIDAAPASSTHQAIRARWALLSNLGITETSTQFTFGRPGALEAGTDHRGFRDWVKTNLDSVL
jgi:hypothetical protein